MNIPIYDALRKYGQERNILLHMPGHKGGSGFPVRELKEIGNLDFTEVPGLDDLHNPQGVLLRAQKLAAEAWGAGKSLFLVNGATSGIHSLLLAMGEGARVVIPRNAHRSFLGGLILSGGLPEFVECEIDSNLGIALAVTPEKIRSKLQSCEGIQGVFLVSPTYYGTVNEMQSIVELLDAKGIPLMVDEAHGAHLVFHPQYPNSALQEGAQASVHGLHKTMPVLTQAGLLHLAADFSWSDQVQACYDLLTSSSPSYPLMVSIDIGRAIMEERGRELLDQAWDQAERCREEINEICGFYSRSHEYLATDGVAGYDPLKVLIEITDLELDGFQLFHLLRERFQIQLELAGENHILAVFSPFNAKDDWRALPQALREISRQFPRKSRKKLPMSVLPSIPPLAITPREAFLSAQKTVMIKECEGLISAEIVAGYPPGIPCLIPGEVITAEVVEYLNYLKLKGIPVHGLHDRSFQKIQVVNY